MATKLTIYKNNIVRRSIIITELYFINKTNIFKDELFLPSHLTLSLDSNKCLFSPNAGGKSIVSEALSIEYFINVFNASQIILEMQITYWIDYKMVDFICSIDDQRVGISVTRAMGFPEPQQFNLNHARHLLNKKIHGLIIARNGVNENHTFYKSILHIWCQNTTIANFIYDAYNELNLSTFGLDIKGTLIVMLTICNSKNIYSNTKL